MRNHLGSSRLLQSGRWLVGSLVAVWAVCGCAEIEKASPEEAKELADLRSELDKTRELERYTEELKAKLRAANQDPDSIDNYANPEEGRKAREAEPAFQNKWQPLLKQRQATRAKDYAKLAAPVVRACIAEAKAGKTASEVDQCIGRTPPAKIDPMKVAGVAVLVVVLGAVIVVGYRATRRNLDPVAGWWPRWVGSAGGRRRRRRGRSCSALLHSECLLQ